MAAIDWSKIYKKYREKAFSKMETEKDPEAEILVKKFQKLLEINYLKFPDTMTFGELKDKIDQSIDIKENLRNQLIEIINGYEEYRYSANRSKEDFKNLEIMMESIK